jgi:hypothetical protein
MANNSNSATKSTVTDEMLMSITSSSSQEFADLAMPDKLRWFQLDNQRLQAQKMALEKKQKGYGLSASIENGMLTVILPVNDPLEKSSTGKTLAVATTHGNVKTALTVNGKQVVIGVNAYIPVD